MKIELKGKSYPLPSEWSEVTLRQILESRELAESMPEKYNDHLYNTDKEVEFTEDDKIDLWTFKRKWVGFWTGLPTDDDTISITDLDDCYSILMMFLGTPSEKEVTINSTITHKGVTYSLPKTEKIAGGGVKYMADSTYQEFIEGAQLSNRLNRLSEGDLTVLPLLTATYYRPEITTGRWFWRRTRVEGYNEDKVKARAEVFMDLPMDKVWGAYFFLDVHLSEYLSGLQTSFLVGVSPTNTGGTT